MRYVARNRPFVVRNGAAHWDAHRKWNSAQLRAVMHDTPVNVAITPHGNADSILHLPDAGALFVKPLERSEPFHRAMTNIAMQATDPSYTGPTRYLQTQNDNLRGEYATLFGDVPKSIPWARIALDKEPDAINFWLGNGASTTALHKDNYENVYVQVLGKKHFVLLPPVEAPCVNEKAVLAATYVDASAHPDSSVISKEDLVVKIDEAEDVECKVTYVPFATWDPDNPMEHATPFSKDSRPLRVTLNEGDMLYLPALWYHKVSQSCNDEGLCCAVNYWYDLDFTGGFWASASFLRGVGLIAQERHQQPYQQSGSDIRHPALGSQKPSPRPMSLTKEDGATKNWPHEFQRDVGPSEQDSTPAQDLPRSFVPPSNADGGVPRPWSNAEKSDAFDRWVREWYQQDSAQERTQSLHKPSAIVAGQGLQATSNEEKGNTMDDWVKQWTAAREQTSGR